MNVPRDVYAAAVSVRTDLLMLLRGEWEPDADSTQASLDNAEKVVEWLETQKVAP